MYGDGFSECSVWYSDSGLLWYGFVSCWLIWICISLLVVMYFLVWCMVVR